MNRLTRKTSTGEYAPVFEGATATVNDFYRCVERLATIEDILGNTYDIDRLRELVDADKEGRCEIFPCKNGDTVWYITPQRELCEAKIIGIWLNIHTNPQLWIEINYFSELTGQGDFKSRIDLILGKTVFLAREAAQAALEGDYHAEAD